MAKTLAERLIAAKSPRARLSDNEQLLADLKAERDRLTDARDQAAGESIDFALSDADRDEAATKAGRYERTAKGIEAEVAGLAALIEERRDEEAVAKAEAERVATLAERDQLAEQFREAVPRLTGELIALFAAVKANRARMQANRLNLPCAEAVARNVPQFLEIAGQAARFLDMRIPRFEGEGRAWPPSETVDLRMLDVGAQIRRARKAAEKREAEKAKAAAELAASHGVYRLSTQWADYTPVDIPAALRERAPILPFKVTNARRELEYTIPHSVAEELAKVESLNVDRIDQGKKK